MPLELELWWMIARVDFPSMGNPCIISWVLQHLVSTLSSMMSVLLRLTHKLLLRKFAFWVVEFLLVKFHSYSYIKEALYLSYTSADIHCVHSIWRTSSCINLPLCSITSLNKKQRNMKRKILLFSFLCMGGRYGGCLVACNVTVPTFPVSLYWVLDVALSHIINYPGWILIFFSGENCCSEVWGTNT